MSKEAADIEIFSIMDEIQTFAMRSETITRDERIHLFAIAEMCLIASLKLNDNREKLDKMYKRKDEGKWVTVGEEGFPRRVCVGDMIEFRTKDEDGNLYIATGHLRGLNPLRASYCPPQDTKEPDEVYDIEVNIEEGDLL